MSVNEINVKKENLDMHTANLLSSQRAIANVIGAISNNTLLLRDPSINITTEDFVQRFHKILFLAINNLTYKDENIKKINAMDVDDYLSKFPDKYEEFKQYNGYEYLQNCIDKSDESYFKVNYDEMKKFTLLRLYLSNGIDISDVYDIDNVSAIGKTKENEKIDKMSIDDIIQYFTIKMIRVKDSFVNGVDDSRFMIGDNIKNTLENASKMKAWGFPFYLNNAYNTLFRGMQRGKLMLTSADSGAGKTRTMFSFMLLLSCSSYFDLDNNVWVNKEDNVIPTCFISTELDEEEVGLISLATISGVNEAKIRKGYCNKEEKERLNKAVEILKDTKMQCEYIEDFDIMDIEMMIERNVIELDIEAVAFDYMQMTPRLFNYMRITYGGNVREDQAMREFSERLKCIARKLDIFILSGTQLNREGSDVDKRDASALRGGRATVDKIDIGVLLFNATPKDLKELRPITETGVYDIPNYSHWIYKNRSGEKKSIVVWTKMDLGTMREKTLFVTDYNYNLIEDMEFTKLKTKKEGFPTKDIDFNSDITY